MEPGQAAFAKRRNWYKCDGCRSKRQKCKPFPRDFSAGQKCDECRKFDLGCGPNRTKKEAESSGRLQQASDEHAGTSQSTQSDIQARETGSLHIQDDHRTDDARPEQHESVARGLQSTLIVPTLSTLLQDLGFLDIAFDKVNDLRNALPKYDGAMPRAARIDADLVTGHLVNLEYGLRNRFESVLNKVRELGEEADRDGRRLQAEKAYVRSLRVLENFERLSPASAKSLVDYKINLLRALISISQREDDKAETERLLLKLSRLETETSPLMRLETSRLLASSFQVTSAHLARMISDLKLPASTLDLTDPFPPSHRAVQHGNYDVMLQVFVDGFEAFGATDVIKEQAVHIAAATGRLEVMDFLLPESSLINDQDVLGRTPLHIAASNGNQDMCLALLNAGASPAERDSDKHTILEIATKAGHLHVVKLLVGRNTDIVNQPAMYGTSTALQAGAEGGYHDICKFLLESGALSDVRRLHDGLTAAQIAGQKGYADIVHIIHNSDFQQIQAEQEEPSIEEQRRRNARPSASDHDIPSFVQFLNDDHDDELVASQQMYTTSS